MKSAKVNLENFKPKLRPGRVIPHGTQIVFETESPYNQIVLPMALADLVLLCGGQFTVRQIIEKIYRKTGTVPFRWILFTIHSLHQGDFFENGDELNLGPQLQSWVTPKRQGWNLSWRFGQRFESTKRSMLGFYAMSLFILVFSGLGLQYFPGHPIELLQTWSSAESSFTLIWQAFLFSSLLQTVRYLICGAQLLLLTGKMYNLSLRLSPWGLYLHIGDESNHFSERTFFTALFYMSQVLVPWTAVFFASFALSQSLFQTALVVALLTTYWELNPFVAGSGRKILRAIFMSDHEEVASWHFRDSLLMSTLNPEIKRQEQELSRIFQAWSSIWLLLSIAFLNATATTFGPGSISDLKNMDDTLVFKGLALAFWLTALYFTVDGLINRILAPILLPIVSAVKDWFHGVLSTPESRWAKPKLLEEIQKLPLFSHFPDRHLSELIDTCELVGLRAKFDVVREGNPSREIFILLEGQVEIFRNHGEADWITELRSTSIFGESALVDNKPRGATVRTKSKCTILKVPVAQIRKTAEEAQTIRHLDDFRDAILVNQFFASSPVFRSLSPESIDYLSSRGNLEIFNYDHCVIEEGDHGDALFLILRGSVDVYVHGRRTKRLDQGSFFGEIAMIANVPRTATVRTGEPCVLFKLPADAFWEVLVHHMDLGVFLESISDARLKEGLKSVEDHPRTGTDS